MKKKTSESARIQECFDIDPCGWGVRCLHCGKLFRNSGEWHSHAGRCLGVAKEAAASDAEQMTFGDWREGLTRKRARRARKAVRP